MTKRIKDINVNKDKRKYVKKSTGKNMCKMVAFVFILIVSSLLMMCFVKNKNNETKKIKIGKNSTSQEIVDYVLNISSYKSIIDVEIKSNKNSNKYKLKQTYISAENSTQEVIEPTNIQGVKIIKEGTILKIENTKLNISKILEGYKEITQNVLDLSSFIENYKCNENSHFEEQGNLLLLKTTVMSNNNYQKYETLYISREDGKPVKMEIKDTNQNLIIYIIYNELEI